MEARCPICRRPLPLSPDASFRPFCSERCRMVDLARWLDGSYPVPGSPASSAEDGDQGAGSTE